MSVSHATRTAGGAEALTPDTEGSLENVETLDTRDVSDTPGPHGRPMASAAGLGPWPALAQLKRMGVGACGGSDRVRRHQPFTDTLDTPDIVDTLDAQRLQGVQTPKALWTL